MLQYIQYRYAVLRSFFFCILRHRLSIKHSTFVLHSCSIIDPCWVLKKFRDLLSSLRIYMDGIYLNYLSSLFALDMKISHGNHFNCMSNCTVADYSNNRNVCSDSSLNSNWSIAKSAIFTYAPPVCYGSLQCGIFLSGNHITNRWYIWYGPKNSRDASNIYIYYAVALRLDQILCWASERRSRGHKRGSRGGRWGDRNRF